MRGRGLKIGTGMVVVATSLAGSGSALAAVTAKPASQASTCSQSGIQDALNRGGTYDFRAACTIKLTKTLTLSKGTVILDGNGHTVLFDGTSDLKTAAFQIKAGDFSLANVEIENVTAYGTGGDSGREGTSPSGTTGQSGGDGGDGTAGQAIDGAGISAAKGTTVSLSHDTFEAIYSNGGFGGWGGDGGTGADNLGHGNGGKGGKGGKGGSGGNALGGAVYSAGTLTVIGGLFKDDAAEGGQGGSGANGGAGGDGAPTQPNGNGGAGGNGGNGGKGGAAYGGAIYAAGPLTVKGTSFLDDQALGGPGGSISDLAAGGNGGDAGGSGTSQGTGNGGKGGNGGAGGSGGSAGGGAIDDLATTSLAGAGFHDNSVGGGIVSPDCSTSGNYGCGGAGGFGGENGGIPTTDADNGSKGANGKPGTGTDPNFPKFNKNSGLPIMTVTTTSLPAAVKGHSYSKTLAAKGGITPYTWTISGLPAGLKATPAGVISGTAKKTGTFHVSVAVSDLTAAEHTTGRATFKLTVKS